MVLPVTYIVFRNGMSSVWKVTNKGELILLPGDFHAHNVRFEKEGNIITAHEEIPHTLVKTITDGSVDTFYYTQEYKVGGPVIRPRTILIQESGLKKVLFNYDTYQKGELIPGLSRNNDKFWWIFGLGKIAIFVLIIGIKKRIKLNPIV
jgi:hypothetical protein